MTAGTDGLSLRLIRRKYRLPLSIRKENLLLSVCAGDSFCSDSDPDPELIVSLSVPSPVLFLTVSSLCPVPFRHVSGLHSMQLVCISQRENLSDLGF